MIREKEIESYFVKQVEKAGGKAYKWVSPGSDGVPDRIAIFQGGAMGFVELKAPGRKLSPRQVVRHRELKRLTGIVSLVWVIDSKEQVDEFIRIFTNEI